jgi:hypothetical protein|nr:MAG TPA: hypothetical protein [Caudoviricetes sp.]
MKKVTIVFQPDGGVSVDANGCAWVDYLTALSGLATFARQKIKKPARFVDAEIRTATSRELEGAVTEKVKK